jgi:hypothetical protein
MKKRDEESIMEAKRIDAIKLCSVSPQGRNLRCDSGNHRRMLEPNATAGKLMQKNHGVVATANEKT